MTDLSQKRVKGLLERLKDGETVICAEGYLFEFERRGYLKAGAFVPEVVIEHPDLVRSMHEEFVHCGSDVVEAFTYYGHRHKLKVIDREDDVEKLNRKALEIARQVADKTGTLMAGNICNTTMYEPNNEAIERECYKMFKEQVEWAVEGGADYIIGETFSFLGEAKLALQCIKDVKKDMPAVITLVPNSSGMTACGDEFTKALRELEELGADVVGFNCARGPETILPLMKEARKECKGRLACLPVTYRTSDKEGLCMQNLQDPVTGSRAFPYDLDAFLCSRSQIRKLTEELSAIGVQYIGLCCGNCAHYVRTMAETLGRTPPASKYTANMAQHYSQLKGETAELNKQAWYQKYGIKPSA